MTLTFKEKIQVDQQEPWRGCSFCAHYQGDSKCKAFPDRIPIQTISGVLPHTKVFPGQEGDFVFKDNGD